jgi:hypothetical protein
MPKPKPVLKTMIHGMSSFFKPVVVVRQTDEEAELQRCAVLQRISEKKAMEADLASMRSKWGVKSWAANPSRGPITTASAWNNVMHAYITEEKRRGETSATWEWQKPPTRPTDFDVHPISVVT